MCYPLQDDDSEVKATTLSTHVVGNFSEEGFSKFSFNRLIRCVGFILLWLRMFRNKQRSVLSAIDLYKAKIAIIRIVQNEAFGSLCHSVKTNSLIRKDPFRKLNLFIDLEGILRVGGRFIQSEDLYDVKFPILIAGKSHVAKLIISHCHTLVFHQGRVMTINCVF